MLEKEIRAARRLFRELKGRAPEEIRQSLSILEQIRKLVLAEAKLSSEEMLFEPPEGLRDEDTEA
ncbi:MAG: hypothetical protein LBD02_09665 [Christensenellaceae bacterium]|jgi:hypothetical protein|nr:hypothetical protein [Christensenellaceae bacterium]